VTVALRTSNTDREILLEWAERGRIPETRVTDALAAARITPATQDWRVFLDRLLLGCGAISLAAGVIFFIAYNWTALGRYAKFALVEAVVVASIVAVWVRGVDRPSGKAALTFASVATGGLLALVGQTYQTGADTWELFAAWGALILPWALTARFAALWVLWIAIANVAVTLYFQTFNWFFNLFISTERQAWALFVFNTAALVVWEMSAARLQWLNERWAIRLLAVAGGAVVTGLATIAIIDWEGQILTLLVYGAWLATLYFVYRRLIFDLFMIAGGCLSALIVATDVLAKHLIARGPGEEWGFFLTAVAVIGMTAGAAVWLRTIDREHAGDA
jgi:uncharacterized membrane protein